MAVEVVPPLFPPIAKARESRALGTVYAFSGEGGYIYYGQVGPAKGLVGFVKHRGKELQTEQEVLRCGRMVRLPVVLGSIGAGMRTGHVLKLGTHALHPGFSERRMLVNWPVGTNRVTVFALWDKEPAQPGSTESWTTTVDDPAIQDFELMTLGYDAVYHLPKRFTADFGEERADWHIGGPIWRERKVKMERAERFPNCPWQQLPKD